MVIWGAGEVLLGMHNWNRSRRQKISREDNQSGYPGFRALDGRDRENGICRGGARILCLRWQRWRLQRKDDRSWSRDFILTKTNSRNSANKANHGKR